MADAKIERERLEQILEAIPQIALVIDTAGVIRYINRVETGYDPDEVIGSRADSVIHPDSHLIFRAAFEAVFATGGEEEYEVKTVAPDGSTQWYRSVMKPIWTAGRVTAVILIANNISKLRAAQEEAERLRGLLPICAWCGRIRGVDGVWEKLDTFVSGKLSRRITHAQCPECAERSLADHENTRGELRGH